MSGDEVHLDEVLRDLRARCRRRKRGRIICTVELLEGVVVSHRCEERDATEKDLSRIMRERPWKRGAS